MKKIAVCVCYRTRNFGSMLQSYATLLKLEEQNVDYEIVRYQKKITPLFIIRSLPRLLNRFLWSDKILVIQKKIKMGFHPEERRNNEIRNRIFDDFRDRVFVRLSPVYHGYDELAEQSKKYSAGLVGSDQLWSPSGTASNFYNLRFLSDPVPKISYASSFGVSKLPFYQVKRTKAYLERFDFISVREMAGQQIVRELTGLQVPVVLDPTLLFDGGQWNRFLPDEPSDRGPYLFAYFLGPNPHHRQAVERAGKALGLKIVALHHLDQYVPADEGFGDEAPYRVGPHEFLNLIRHASYVCTDSFHGSAFSILYHKQFVVFNRYSDHAAVSKNSRIDSLLDSLGLQSRRCRLDVGREITEPIDYDSVDARLEKLRKASLDYLDRALACVRGESR